MAVETKKIGQLPIIEEMTEGTNLLVEEGGMTKRIPRDKSIPSGLVKSVNGKKPDAEGNVNVSGLPEGGVPYQQLVTDSEGKAVWEERTHYDNSVEYEGWDGTTTSGENYLSAFQMHRITKNVTSFSQIDGATIEITIPDENNTKRTVAINASIATEIMPGWEMMLIEELAGNTSYQIYIFAAANDLSIEGVDVGAGLYTDIDMDGGKGYVSKLTVPGVCTLDPIYIPDEVTFYLDTSAELVYKDAAHTEVVSENEVRSAFRKGINLYCGDVGFTAKAVSVLWDMSDGECEIIYINPESYEIKHARNYTGDSVTPA